MTEQPDTPSAVPNPPAVPSPPGERPRTGAPNLYLSAVTSSPSYIPMYRPMSANGKRLLKPRPKPYDQWTEEEWRIYDEHIREVRSKVGRIGGINSRRIYAKGKSNVSSIMCHREDYKIISAYSRRKGVSMPTILHEVAMQIVNEIMPDVLDEPGPSAPSTPPQS